MSTTKEEATLSNTPEKVESGMEDVELEVVDLGEDVEGVQGDDNDQDLREEPTEGVPHDEESLDERSTASGSSTPSEKEPHTSGKEPLPTISTPNKPSKPFSLHVKSPPPPPSPSFIPRPTSTPPGIQVTPPANDSHGSPWGYNETEEDLQPTWLEGSGSRQQKSWMENGHEYALGAGNGHLKGPNGRRVPTPLSVPVPFESISLADDDADTTPSVSALGQANVMQRSQSGHGSLMNGDERKSGLGGFLRRSTSAGNSASGKNSMAKTSGVGSVTQTMTRNNSIHEEKDHASGNEVSQEASTSTTSTSTIQSPAQTPSDTPSQGGRISAPPAIPHSSNPTIAALISKGLDPNTAPSYLATSPVNASAPEAGQKEKKEKRRSFLEGLKKGKKEEGKGKGKGVVPDSEGAVTTVHANNVNEVHHTATGPSMLDKVRSHTRQAHLPPKAHEEDEAHLRAWEAMMASARAADVKRLERQAVMREEREKKLKEGLPLWESILALYGDGSKTGWKETVAGDPKLRKVWEEGCPSHLRGRVWAMCIGNGLALSKGSFKSCSVRAHRAIDSGRFPQDILQQIDDSTSNVFPVLKLFQPGSPLQEELKELICAWYVSRTDEGLGYVPGISLLAAMLLMTMSLPLAFVALRNLLERGVLRAFYSGLTEESEAYFRIFDNLQADLFPKIYANCKHLGIRLPSSYFSTMFLHQLPFEASCRVWDQILLHGDGYIFRVALAILAILEPRLYFPDKNEILSILEGRNPATLAIVAREKERARQKGLSFEEDVDGVLSVFHVDEKAIFERLSEDNWKESRYERLAQRELPDI